MTPSEHLQAAKEAVAKKYRFKNWDNLEKRYSAEDISIDVLDGCIEEAALLALTNQAEELRKQQEKTGLKSIDGIDAYYGDIIEHSTTEGGIFRRVISWDEELQTTMIDNMPYYKLHESGYIQPSKLEFRIIGNIYNVPVLPEPKHSENVSRKNYERQKREAFEGGALVEWRDLPTEYKTLVDGKDSLKDGAYPLDPSKWDVVYNWQQGEPHKSSYKLTATIKPIDEITQKANDVERVAFENLKPKENTAHGYTEGNAPICIQTGKPCGFPCYDKCPIHDPTIATDSTFSEHFKDFTPEMSKRLSKPIINQVEPQEPTRTPRANQYRQDK